MLYKSMAYGAATLATLALYIHIAVGVAPRPLDKRISRFIHSGH